MKIQKKLTLPGGLISADARKSTRGAVEHKFVSMAGYPAGQPQYQNR
jgi:hypothetical protein